MLVLQVDEVDVIGCSGDEVRELIDMEAGQSFDVRAVCIIFTLFIAVVVIARRSHAIDGLLQRRYLACGPVNKNIAVLIEDGCYELAIGVLAHLRHELVAQVALRIHL